MSAKEALERYFARVAEKEARSAKPKRKNQQPEESLKKEVLVWLRTNGFSVHSVESKAVFSQRLGRHMNSQTVLGFSDIAGVCPNGVGCFIELKAPGRRSTLRPAQRVFLTDKITLGTFALVIDSIEDLESTWKTFLTLMELRQKTDFLLHHLPKEKEEAWQSFE